MPPIGRVAGVFSFSKSIMTSAIPVPKIAAFSKTSPTSCLIFCFLKSSVNLSRRYLIFILSVCFSCNCAWNICACSSVIFSEGLGISMSSRISKNLPRPKVASSISATLDSIAWEVAGEIIWLLSLALVLSLGS